MTIDLRSLIVLKVSNIFTSDFRSSAAVGSSKTKTDASEKTALDMAIFATVRGAWLFADTPKGATANSVLYTIVESARANELDVYEYIKYLLTVMPDIILIIIPNYWINACRGRKNCQTDAG